jgi:hypothetical protein
VLKILKATLAAAMVAAFVIPLAGGAAASPPGTITFETTRLGPMGTFELSGAFADSGTFTGSDGTITLVRNVRVTWGGDPSVRTITGNWVVISGTGAYEGLAARGTINGTVEGAPPAELFVLTYTGTAVEG